MADNPHRGHRDRMKEKFLEQGIDALQSHEVLELLLYYAISQKNTNELAHRLIHRFGSLPAVLDADVEELCRVPGISVHTATLLTLCGQLLGRYHKEKVHHTRQFASLEDMGRYLHALLFNEAEEKVVLLCLDNRGQLLHCAVVNEGSVAATEVNTRRIVEMALRHSCTAAVLAHNHPRGFAIPSAGDVMATQQLYRALKLVDVELLDHVVVAREDYVSMRQSPRFLNVFKAE